MNNVAIDEIIEIRDLGNDGQGIGNFSSGKTCFVDGALPGETVKVRIINEKKNLAEAQLLEIIKASPERIDADKQLPLAGCNLGHLTYEAQLKYKQDKVVNCLIRIGHFEKEFIDSIMQPIVGSPRQIRYRNHMQYKIADGLICETARGDIKPIPVDENLIEYEVFGKVRKALETIFSNAPTFLFDGVVLRGSERTREILVELVTSDTRPHEVVIRDVSDYVDACEVVDKLKEACGEYSLNGLLLRISPDKTSKRTRSGKRVTIYGVDYYEEKMCGRTFRVKAGAFFQVNVEQAEKLYEIASNSMSDANVLGDIYCGTGTIGLSCVKEHQTLIGIESVSEAVESAKLNAKLSGVNNARFICRPAEKVDFIKEKLPVPDAMIVDPPRKGMDEVFVRRLIELAPDKISYVSCDPATMARDLKMLSKAYTVTSCTPVDLFANTSHVETVALLTKHNVDEHIYVDLEMSELDITSAEKKAWNN